MQHTIEVTLLGGFSLTADGKTIVPCTVRPAKPNELLALLLLHRTKQLTNEQLMHALWPGEEDAENPANALKNLVYSLRKMLRAVDETENFIITENGRYCWNSQVPVGTDTERLEELHAALCGTNPLRGQAAVAAGLRAAELYAGDLLPGAENGAWVYRHAVVYRRRYIETVLALCEALRAEGGRQADESIIAACNKAAELEPANAELQLCIFEAMYRQNMRESILHSYGAVSNLFYDELGEAPPARIREIYGWAAEGSEHSEVDLLHIQRDLTEVTRDNKPVHGAYFCPYEMFKHMYRFVARSAERAGNTNVLMLVTLKAQDGTPLPKQDNITAMQLLKELIQRTLRKGDVFSRYGRSQYIIMLSVAKASDVQPVCRRLEAAYGHGYLADDVYPEIRTLELEPIIRRKENAE